MRKHCFHLFTLALLCLLFGCASKTNSNKNEIPFILDTIRWGMSVAEIEQATGKRVEKMAKPYFPNRDSYKMAGISINGMEFSVKLRMGPEGLELIELETPKYSDKEFQQIVSFLQKRYGNQKLLGRTGKLFNFSAKRPISPPPPHWQTKESYIFCHRKFLSSTDGITILARKNTGDLKEYSNR